MIEVWFADRDELVELHAKYLAVFEEQGDIHDNVVEVCSLLLGLFPEVQVVIVDAVDASGSRVGFGGFDLAAKKIPRDNLPTPGSIQWNQTWIWATNFLQTRTGLGERLRAEERLVREVAELIPGWAEQWAAVGFATARCCSDHGRIDSDARQIPSSKPARTPDGLPIREAPTGELHIGDAADLCGQLMSNALPRVVERADASITSHLQADLLPKLSRLAQPAYWSYIESPPVDAATLIGDSLQKVHDVLAWRVLSGGSEQSSAERRIRRRSGAVLAEFRQILPEQPKP